MRAAGCRSLWWALYLVSTKIRRVIGGKRYRDKRPVAVSMWQTIMDVLEQIGALPKAAQQ